MVRRFLRRKVFSIYLKYLNRKARAWECWETSSNIDELVDCIIERTLKAKNTLIAKILQKLLEVVM